MGGGRTGGGGGGSPSTPLTATPPPPAAVPTTLGIGVSLVRSCKGNDGLALLLTVGTNMLGIVTM